MVLVIQLNTSIMTWRIKFWNMATKFQQIYYCFIFLSNVYWVWISKNSHVSRGCWGCWCCSLVYPLWCPDPLLLRRVEPPVASPQRRRLRTVITTTDRAGIQQIIHTLILGIMHIFFILKIIHIFVLGTTLNYTQVYIGNYMQVYAENYTHVYWKLLSIHYTLV